MPFHPGIIELHRRSSLPPSGKHTRTGPLPPPRSNPPQPPLPSNECTSRPCSQERNRLAQRVDGAPATLGGRDSRRGHARRSCFAAQCPCPWLRFAKPYLRPPTNVILPASPAQTGSEQGDGHLNSHKSQIPLTRWHARAYSHAERPPSPRWFASANPKRRINRARELRLPAGAQFHRANPLSHGLFDRSIDPFPRASLEQAHCPVLSG